MSVMSLVSSGPLLLAMPVAAAAGAVTFLSPCCLPLVPGYLSYLTGMSGADAATATTAAATAEVAVDGGGVTTRTRTTTVTAPPKGRAVAGTALFILGF